MRHSHILALLRHSVSSASPPASTQPRQRVCVPAASPVPSHTAARALFSDSAMIGHGHDEPYYSQPLGRRRATDRATSGLLLSRPATC
jgi:hypothetical protein